MVDLKILERIALVEYSEIVKLTSMLHNKLRLYLFDNSYVDIWYSKKIKERRAYTFL